MLGGGLTSQRLGGRQLLLLACTVRRRHVPLSMRASSCGTDSHVPQQLRDEVHGFACSPTLPASDATVLVRYMYDGGTLARDGRLLLVEPKTPVSVSAIEVLRALHADGVNLEHWYASVYESMETSGAWLPVLRSVLNPLAEDPDAAEIDGEPNVSLVTFLIIYLMTSQMTSQMTPQMTSLIMTSQMTSLMTSLMTSKKVCFEVGARAGPSSDASQPGIELGLGQRRRRIDVKLFRRTEADSPFQPVSLTTHHLPQLSRPTFPHISPNIFSQ